MSNDKEYTEVAEWDQVVTIREAGELTARWLEGTMSYHPGYPDPDPETQEITPALVTLNRNGFFTISSQPGHGPKRGYDGNWWWRRAGVKGFGASGPSWYQVYRTAKDAGLIWISHKKAGWHYFYRGAVDVTISVPYEGEPSESDTYYRHIMFGARLSRKTIDTEIMDGHPQAQMMLYHTPQFTIIDPVWGRKDYLWKIVTSAVKEQRQPYAKNGRHHER